VRGQAACGAREQGARAELGGAGRRRWRRPWSCASGVASRRTGGGLVGDGVLGEGGPRRVPAAGGGVHRQADTARRRRPAFTGALAVVVE
jgi:hypothetical protein